MAKVIGFEISSQDPEKAIEFYKIVFGWDVEDSIKSNRGMIAFHLQFIAFKTVYIELN